MKEPPQQLLVPVLESWELPPASSSLPVLLLRVRSSYLICALVIAGFSLVATFGVSFGVFETKDMIARFTQQKEKEASPHFFDQMKRALKNRNLLAFVLLLFFYQSGCMLMTASVNYVVKYVLAAKKAAKPPQFSQECW